MKHVLGFLAFAGAFFLALSSLFHFGLSAAAAFLFFFI